MGEYGKPGLLHVNADDRWLAMALDGLEIGPDGAVRLFPLPRLDGELPQDVERAPDPLDASGLLVAWDGSVYFTDAEANRLTRVDGCSGEQGRVGCFGEGHEAGPLHGPAGLAPLAGGTLVAINDAGADRIVLLDAARGAVVEVWNGIAAAAIASDEHGNLYVADRDANRVRRLDRNGVVRWESPAPLVDRPVALAAAGGRVFALGRAEAEGEWGIVGWRPDTSDPPIVLGAGWLARPMGLAATADAVYAGDNESRRVLKFSVRNDALSGAAVGYRGPVRALAADGRGGLYVHAGGSAAPIRLTLDAGCRTSGTMWGRVATPRELPVVWHRVRASIVAGAEQSHLQFYVATERPAGPTDATQPFGPAWRAKGLDVGDFFVDARRSDSFWLGVHMFGDGASSPAISQICVTYDQPTYQALLPPLYREEGTCGDFLLRYLSLFESFFAEEEESIASMARLFDPGAAPGDVLPWLASWLAVDWDERWSDARQRDAIAGAFERYGRRGTVAGVRESVQTYGGVRALVHEPIRETGWWGLPAEPDCTGAGGSSASTLGSTSVLASAEAQGAVVGVSAVLDRSHLIRNDDFGKPLFEDVAHRFTVVLYSGDARNPDTVAKVREILDREKPAHTTYDLCVVAPGFRVGRQARVGIDAVVGGAEPPGRLGDEGGVRLGAEPAVPLGRGPRVGINTRL
jgi:phage tail-like protein